MGFAGIAALHFIARNLHLVGSSIYSSVFLLYTGSVFTGHLL